MNTAIIIGGYNFRNISTLYLRKKMEMFTPYSQFMVIFSDVKARWRR